MRKTINKFLAFALTLALSVTVLCPVTSQAEPSAPDSMTFYRTTKGSGSSRITINISNLKKSDTIKKSSVKSSNKKVAKLNYLCKNTDQYKYDYKYFSSSNSDSTYKYDNYSYSINLDVLKAGKSTISYKIGDKTYKTKLTVKNYTNPLKSVKLTGVSSGKNIAGKLKKQNSANVTLKKNTKNAVLKLTANKNWKITDIYFTTYKDDNLDNQLSYYTYNTGKSSATLRVGTLKKNTRYQAQISMFNTKTGGSITCFYYINN